MMMSQPPTIDTGRELAGANRASNNTDWPGILDAKQLSGKADVINFACQISSIAKRYKEIHRALFGISIRNVLSASRRRQQQNFDTLELELDTIKTESEQVRSAIADMEFTDLHKRAKKTDTIRKALEEYAKAVADAASKLKLVCQNLYLEEDSTDNDQLQQYRRDKAIYDASVQEFKRWGTRLTELFDKF